MKRIEKQLWHTAQISIVIVFAVLFILTGCNSKENLPTDQELAAKITQEQRQKQEQKMASARQELDHYFDTLASLVKKLENEKTAFFTAFADLNEKKITEQQAKNQIASSIAEYRKKLDELKAAQVPPYKEVEQFHQEMYGVMEAYTPVMKKAEEGLRTKNPTLLKDAEKRMNELDAQAKKIFEKSAHLQVKIKAN
jgi:uncharacterized membrane-anchored protein YhcB (DUF1043 family)